MMRFLISFLPFFFLVVVLQEATCFNQHKELSHNIRNKLKGRLAISLSHSPSQTAKARSRVVYPAEYGADTSGARDSSDAIIKALEDAFSLESEAELLPGVKDLGGVLVDLQGGNYTISKPIKFPSSAAGNLVVQGGTLRASDAFPTDRHLVELWASSSQKLSKTASFDDLYNRKLQQPKGIYYEDITFRDILFDSGYHGGGIFVVDSARIRINNCFFLHFTTEGILVQGGHETYISSCFLGQHSTVGGDSGERQFSGTAIELASNDNAITDIAIFSSAVGIVLRGQANIVTGVHCYNKATGFGGIGILVMLAGNSQTRIDNCYMDYTAIVMEDPVQVHVTNGFFLGDANIVLKSIKGQISGLKIVNNMFTGNPNAKVPIVALDGVFGNVDQVVIDLNSVDGMGLRSTVGKQSVAGNGTKWVADFSGVLVFPNRINHIQYSFYSQGGPNNNNNNKFVPHAVTNVTNNVVVVESDKPVNGVVSFLVEQ
ncbi:hypothetical protein HN51_004518 [Arachis hypogaea]|uniref:Pectate lyase superfamily protein domain-containing protein n=1 Tax=Arachis hypogaea TaxID=3818 RepID=A0A445DI80_ARAHY|nr:polygalacturonase QRT3 [Arachis hypogaea]QHO38092.1 Polygalacturonase [Arachis hypogaea]RYR62888.1 hypothetical protein Ahy_A04g020641 [Arachis hypogaea]